MLYDSLRIGTLELKNRLVMPPMFTGRSRLGHVTDDLVAYYRERALGSAPGLIITEHSCITEQGRATAQQLSIVSEELIDEHRRITDAIHEADNTRIYTSGTTNIFRYPELMDPEKTTELSTWQIRSTN